VDGKLHSTSAKSPFDSESLSAQLKRVDALPSDELHAGVVAKDGNVGVAVDASKTIGKGWAVAGSFEAMHVTGWAAAAGLTWKKTS
jgi:hypothetical protein